MSKKTIKQNNKRKKKKRNNNKANKIAIITGVSVLIVVFIFSAVQFVISPPKAEKGKAIFYIEEGAALDTIAKVLDDNNLIKYPFVFKTYIKLTGQAPELKAGNYSIAYGSTMNEIVKELKKGGNRETRTITVKEGLDLNRISIYFEEETGLFSADEFLAEVKNNFDYYKEKYSFLKDVPSDREYPLEGYLFGDTYEVYTDATPREVITKMLDRFEEIFTEEYQKKAAEMGLTIDEAVIMASIVEREGILDKELPTIASVFYNRIDKGMKLQSCATLQYIYKDYQFYFTSDQMAVDNPYNTYKYDGLPKGPISNFRASALEAVLYPKDTDYLYFCSKNDGTGSSAFAKTYNQHQSNIRKYESSWK